MARVKQEVRQQQRLLQKPHAQAAMKPQAHSLVRTADVSPMATLAPPRVSVTPANGRAPESTAADACIDLTLDDDSEDDDEPFTGDSHEVVAVSAPGGVEPQVPAIAAALDAAVSDGCESDVDEALPVGDHLEMPPTAAACEDASRESGETERMELALLSANEAESEEDEDLPRIAAASSPVIANDAELATVTATADEGSSGETLPHEGDDTQHATAVESLEDGEIFEEGAVIKSPTAVKAVIALELQASRAAAAEEAPVVKKKQKKRGRKKNKRKAEAAMMLMMATGEQEPRLTPLSPEIRPLTASSQSLVIRISMDDVMSKKARKDSYDDAALRNPAAPVAELKRQIAAKEQELRATRSGPETPAKGTQQAKRATELEQSIAAMKKAIQDRERARQSNAVTDSSSLPSTSPGELTHEFFGSSQDSVQPDGSVPVPQVKRAELMKEYEQCRREVELADLHLARLDARIAQVKVAIATAAAQVIDE
ncbi:hypothetical protein P43SY_002802 [Pythium insidiosum]|uniref:Uncharacterized protein n=1 Tax=Pythium insidiosum TaxID=114742 RepID=A0AAD5LSE1_PYTIN|nr:hypothetical protein P43SY_002802 [Pythium insidiosum]